MNEKIWKEVKFGDTVNARWTDPDKGVPTQTYPRFHIGLWRFLWVQQKLPGWSIITVVTGRAGGGEIKYSLSDVLNVLWVLHYLLGAKAESVGLGSRVWAYQLLAGSKQFCELGSSWWVWAWTTLQITHWAKIMVYVWRKPEKTQYLQRTSTDFSPRQGISTAFRLSPDLHSRISPISNRWRDEGSNKWRPMGSYVFAEARTQKPWTPLLRLVFRLPGCQLSNQPLL